ncbi:unnamed protein product [Xyrichtys novacula]|nr:unnamed protein product [Xyrichtys novacula]
MAYASRSLHPTEQNDANYSSFKLELLALKWAVAEKFKDYLTGTKFTVYTDNNPLAHLQTARLGAVEQRWVAQLSSFDFDIKYRSGKSNVNADVLSRYPVNPLPTGVANTTAGPDTTPVMAAIELTPEGDSEEWAGSEWEVAQSSDPDIQIVKRYVETRALPEKPERQALPLRSQRLLQQWKRLHVQNNILCRKVFDSQTHEVRHQIVCPSARSKEVWGSVHEATAHAGVERTLSRIRQRFYWPNMEGEVRQLQQGCVACSLRRERVEPRAPLKLIEVSYPLEVVGLDFLSLGRNADTHPNILVATDLFTRYAWAVPTRDQTAETTVKALWTQIIQPFGCPARFHSDQGPNFESGLMKQLCDTYGIAKSRTTPYHPAGNGSAERFNHTLFNMLRSLETDKQNHWPEYLPELVHAYNNTAHSATGYAPSFLMFGRHLRLPVDIGLGVGPQQRKHDLDGWVRHHQQRLSVAYGLARQKMDNAASQNKQRYDSKARTLPLLPGERVWLRNRNRQGQGKLCTWWNPETYVVVEQVGDTELVYRVQPERGGRVQTVHRNALKVCTAPPAETAPPAAEAAAETPEIQLPLIYGFPPRPAAIPPAREEPENPPRRSTRENLGQPPVRYGDL